MPVTWSKNPEKRRRQLQHINRYYDKVNNQKRQQKALVRIVAALKSGIV